MGSPATEGARLAEVFRLAPSFFAVFRGPNSIYEFVNEAYYGVVGRRELLGRSVFDVFPESRYQGFLDILRRVLHDGIDAARPSRSHPRDNKCHAPHPRAAANLQYPDRQRRVWYVSEVARFKLVSASVDGPSHFLVSRFEREGEERFAQWVGGADWLQRGALGA